MSGETVKTALVFHLYTGDNPPSSLDDIIGALTEKVIELTGRQVSRAEWDDDKEVTVTEKSMTTEEHEIAVDLYRQRIARLRNALHAVERSSTDHTNTALAGYALEEDEHIARLGTEEEDDTPATAARQRYVRNVLDGMIRTATT